MPAPELPPDAAAAAASRPRAPNRRARISSAGNRSGATPRWDSAGTSLTIPRGIQYSGRIGPCERLTVEGVVETELDGCRVLAVAAGGVFRGTADVETAEISGTLEGSLRVRGTLTVRASARILSDSLSYAEIEIERGGTVTGSVRPLPKDAEQTSPAGTAQPATVRPTSTDHLPGATLTAQARRPDG